MATIQNEDWNPVETKMTSVLGAPDGTTNDLGYNTTYSRGAVVGGDTVTGAQWNALRTDVNKAYLLQTGSNSDLTTRDSTAKITQADLTAISARVDTAYSNRGAISTGQLSSVALTGKTYTLQWSSGVGLSQSANWASNNIYRGFWNAGGRIVWTLSRTGGSATAQNSAWSNLLTNVGSIVLTRNGMFQSGQVWNGTFSNSWNTTGAYGRRPTTNERAFEISAQDTNYTTNIMWLNLNWNSADIKTATQLNWEWSFIDHHQAQGSNTGSEVGGGGPIGFGPDYVDGTLQINCTAYYPFANQPS